MIVKAKLISFFLWHITVKGKRCNEYMALIKLLLEIKRRKKKSPDGCRGDLGLTIHCMKHTKSHFADIRMRHACNSRGITLG